MRAREFIDTSLGSPLPPDVPPFWTRIVRAQFLTKSDSNLREAMGLLELVDGTLAGIDVTLFDGIITYEWLCFDGDLSCEDGKWVRREGEAA
jgi:hypothetical protein